MNALDWVLLASAAVFLLLGWRLGLASGLASLLGIAVGGGTGYLIGGAIVRSTALDDLQRPLTVMASTIVGIALAQLLLTHPSRRLHDRVSASPLSGLNKVGGSVLALGFGTVAVWLLATALALAPATGLAQLMRGSAVLVAIDEAVPTDAGLVLRQLEVATGRPDADPVLTGMGLLPAPAMELPDRGQVSSAASDAAGGAVVRVMGHATCGKTLAGSGIVIAEDLVLTNAHVVAGVPTPYVMANGRRLGAPATLVHFDPSYDVAVLRVPGLGLSPVPLAPAAPVSGDVVAVAGYPHGAGYLQVGAGRVRGSVAATGSDIYGVDGTRREVLVLAAEVRPGLSGGAVLTQSGELLGVVFAGAEGDLRTGYALGAPAVASALATATEGSGVAVSAGPCVGGQRP